METARRIDHLMPTAACTRCGETKIVSEFRTDRQKPRGRDTQCKSCTAERDKARFAKHAAFRAEAIAQGHKTACRVCGERKLISAFPAQPGSQGGSSSECDSCFNRRHTAWRDRNRDHVRASARASARAVRSISDKEKSCAAVRKHRLKRQYGLTPACLIDMRKAQGNKCLVCNETFAETAWGKKAAGIDHDHRTGRVRGLLCTMCNSGIGYFDDNIETMANAIAYLKRHRNG